MCVRFRPMHCVAILAPDGVVAFDLATPPQVFNSLAPQRYETVVCGVDAEVRAAHGFGIRPQAGLEALERADTVIVPGLRDVRAAQPPRGQHALREQPLQGRRGGLCAKAARERARREAGVARHPGDRERLVQAVEHPSARRLEPALQRLRHRPLGELRLAA